MESVLAQEDRERLHQVQGLITLAESDRLAELAAAAPRWTSIVEVGSHTGRSTLWLAAGARAGEGAHITAIDPWPEPGYTAHYEDVKSDDDPFEFSTGQAVFEKFRDNVTEESAWGDLTALRAGSLEVAAQWVNPVGLLFLDAMHGYQDVKNDCDAWLGHVVRDGVLAMHDWFDDGALTHPSQVADALGASWNPASWSVLPMSDNLFVARRR